MEQWIARILHLQGGDQLLTLSVSEMDLIRVFAKRTQLQWQVRIEWRDAIGVIGEVGE